MSVDIDWSLLSVPSPSSLSSSLIDTLNSALNSSSRPSFLGPVTVTSFDFGTIGPDVEIKDIRDVWRAFDEGDKDDIEEDESEVVGGLLGINESGDGGYRDGEMGIGGFYGHDGRGRNEKQVITGPPMTINRSNGGLGSSSRSHYNDNLGNGYHYYTGAEPGPSSARGGGQSRHFTSSSSTSAASASVRRSQSQHQLPQQHQFQQRQGRRRSRLQRPTTVDEGPEFGVNGEEEYDFFQQPISNVPVGGTRGVDDGVDIGKGMDLGDGEGDGMIGMGIEEESIVSGLASPRPSAAAVGLGAGVGIGGVGLGRGRVGGVPIGLGGLVRPSSSSRSSIPRSYSLPPSYSPSPPVFTGLEGGIILPHGDGNGGGGASASAVGLGGVSSVYHRMRHIKHAPPPAALNQQSEFQNNKSRRHSYRSQPTHTRSHGINHAPLSPISSPPLSPPARPRGLGLPPATDNPIPSVQLHLHISHSPNLSITLLTSLQVNYPSNLFMTLPLKLVITGLTVCADVIIAYSGSRNRVHLTIIDDDSGVGGNMGPLGSVGGGGTGMGYVGGGLGAGNGNRSAGGAGRATGGGGGGGNNQSIPIGQRLLPHLHIESEIGHSDAHVLRNVGKVERFITDVVRKTIVDELVFPNFYTIAL